MASTASRYATAIAQDDAVLRQSLAQADGLLAEARPILRHLLHGDDASLLNDEIVARVRGLLASLGAQLAKALWQGTQTSLSSQDIAAQFTIALGERAALLTHLHCAALEWQLAERMEQGLALDPVLPPLLQARIGAEDPAIAATATAMLAAQARFGQAMRRMELALEELPADLFHLALATMRVVAQDAGQADPAMADRVSAAEAHLRRHYEERETRLGLIERVIIALREDAGQALSIERAGVALFLTALAIGSGQDRDAAILATAESQVLRLALSLKVCGLAGEALAAQVLAIHPRAVVPDALDRVLPEQAARLLSEGAGAGGIG